MSVVHLDEQMCRQCGGLCCQGHAGAWVDPQRFMRLFMPCGIYQKKSLPMGVTLKDLGGVEVAAPQTLQDGCYFLGDSGCRLDQHHRPCQCLALEPVIETLMEGEMRCILPPESSSKTARDNWDQFWKSHNGETT